MNGKRVVALVVSVIAMGSPFAQAQERPGAYIGASFGQSKADIDSGALGSNLTAAGLGHTGISADETDSAWKVYGGYRFSRNFAIEGGLVALGEFSARTTVTSVNGVPVTPGSLVITAETDPGPFVSGVGIWPIGQASVFGKVGLYSIKTEGRATASGIGGTATTSSSDRNTDFMFGLGGGYDFTRNFGVRVEWERFMDVGDEDSVGTADIDVFSIGIIYRF